MKVTASISTRNRYDSTLPLCLSAVVLQEKVPDELLIFDDGDHRDLRDDPLYTNIFQHLYKRKIDWKVIFSDGQGQVKNHQKTLEIAKHPFIWRLDDDNVPESNVLLSLCNILEMDHKVGAVASLVLDPKHPLVINKNASSKIEDIFMGLNEQWYAHANDKIKSVDHLYSTFLYRKEAAVHGYEKNLSRVGHREETIFTYEMKRAGWKLYITPKCVTWHYHFPKGGNRDNTKAEMWDKDEQLFIQKMEQWNIKKSNKKLIVLDNGLGDHFAFKTILPQIKEKYKDKNLLLAVCYPDIFDEFNDIKLISIHDAKQMNVNFDDFNIYKFMADKNWNKSIIEAYKEMYLKN